MGGGAASAPHGPASARRIAARSSSDARCQWMRSSVEYESSAGLTGGGGAPGVPFYGPPDVSEERDVVDVPSHLAPARTALRARSRGSARTEIRERRV